MKCLTGLAYLLNGCLLTSYSLIHIFFLIATLAYKSDEGLVNHSSDENNEQNVIFTTDVLTERKVLLSDIGATFCKIINSITKVFWTSTDNAIPMRQARYHSSKFICTISHVANNGTLKTVLLWNAKTWGKKSQPYKISFWHRKFRSMFYRPLICHKSRCKQIAKPAQCHTWTRS